MSELKWTPGPWVAKDVMRDDLFPSVQIGPKPAHGKRAKIIINEGPSPDMVARGDWGGTTMETASANARLIAAAPELYEALEFIFDHIADKERGRDLYPAFGLDSTRAVEMARAALAKARGD